ncbi:ATP-binding protein [Actinomadura physcomitrii]|nr:ATP-binding protein [Actinomadura physcomitrii]
MIVPSAMTEPETRPPVAGEPARAEVLGLAALPSAVPVARYFAHALLGAWRLAEPYGWACRQVLSELVSNALEATGEPGGAPLRLETCDVAMILLRFQCSPAHLIVEVRDGSSECPRVSNAAPLDESGRGLALAGALASEWGVYGVAQGKVVWAAWQLA